MAVVVLVDANGVPTGRTVEREQAYRPSFQGIKPQSHLLLFDQRGQLFTTIRAKKSAWPEQELPFFAGGNVNPARKGEVYENGTGTKIDYKIAAVNETFEESGVMMRPEELRRVQGLPNVISFQQTGTIYLAVHYAIYDPSDHGPFKIDSRETEAIVLRPHSSFDRINAGRTMNDYGEDLMKRVSELSQKIASGEIRGGID